MDIFKLIFYKAGQQGFSWAIPTGFNLSYLAFLTQSIVYSHMPCKALKAFEFSFCKIHIIQVSMLFMILQEINISGLKSGRP